MPKRIIPVLDPFCTKPLCTEDAKADVTSRKCTSLFLQSCFFTLKVASKHLPFHSCNLFPVARRIFPPILQKWDLFITFHVEPWKRSAKGILKIQVRFYPHGYWNSLQFQQVNEAEFPFTEATLITSKKTWVYLFPCSLISLLLLLPLPLFFFFFCKDNTAIF